MTAAEANIPIPPYDAILLVSFGGPEGMDEVTPFLENVLRGKSVPRERMQAVAHHYQVFGGVSPINQQNRDLIAALRQELRARGPDLPIYWGNRNWRPLLPDALREMAADGKHHALAYITSAYSSYSSCRQYLEDIARAQSEVGPGAPRVSPLRKFYNHPDFIHANAERVRAALLELPAARRAAAPIAFTAHSIPDTMARSSRYEAQLRETCRLVAEAVGAERWDLVYQSRSGPPTQSWLEPDIGDHLRELKAAGDSEVLVAPIGFLSDHVEVLYDLDVEARYLATELGLTMARAQTVGTHPAFVAMIGKLIVERVTGSENRPYLGALGAPHDVCPPDCCLPGQARLATTGIASGRLP
jgi:ferrochelatase